MLGRMRAIWKGGVSFGLFSVPVNLYSDRVPRRGPGGGIKKITDDVRIPFPFPRPPGPSPARCRHSYCQPGTMRTSGVQMRPSLTCSRRHRLRSPRDVATSLPSRPH